MGQKDQNPQKPGLAVSPEQLKLMSFGPRREIIAALANDPQLSARDLAARLHRPVTGLYRHIDLLAEAGLLRQSGARPGAKRPEALYTLTFSTFSSLQAAGTAEGRTAVAQAAARYAAATARKFARAVGTGAARLEGPQANARYAVMDLQLDPDGLAEFNRLLTEFFTRARTLRVPDRPGVETINMTLLTAPSP